MVPRWPSTRVFVDDGAYHAVQRAGAMLPDGVQLILTRGYEPKRSRLGRLRIMFRAGGILAFTILFPHRRNEIGPIFGANGHDIDGTHIDVSIEIDGKRLRFLPLGVFTPIRIQRILYDKHAKIVDSVRAALIASGFLIHPNPTESFQIHCDFMGRPEPDGDDSPPSTAAAHL
jgi:hypothetical protein